MKIFIDVIMQKFNILVQNHQTLVLSLKNAKIGTGCGHKLIMIESFTIILMHLKIIYLN